MTIKATFRPYKLRFRFEAGTSRGVLTERMVYFVQVYAAENPEIVGIGEAAPLADLSLDDRPDFEAQIADILQKIEGITLKAHKAYLLDLVDAFVPDYLPSLKFALETALLDWLNGGKKQIFDNAFSQGKVGQVINGLIWMGRRDFMETQIQQKLEAGFTCLKMKIGALDFAQELDILKQIRQKFSADSLSLRVDANGAFAPSEALSKLEQLTALQLHSIEQPIAAGQPETMAKLCQNTPLPIALDEELIGKIEPYERQALLSEIKPQYIILKPSLIGGIRASENWISEAQKLGIDWWMTSALESNIGLNAIAQFTANFKNPLPQGLGTGGLYHNNIDSPLYLKGEKIHYQPDGKWAEITF